VTRRAKLPGAEELFRSTVEQLGVPQSGGSPPTSPRNPASRTEPASGTGAPSRAGAPRPARERRSVEAQLEAERRIELAARSLVEHVEPARAPDPPALPEALPARPRHEEKVTFYCTDAELTRLETARLALRSKHRLSSDRGRIVRAALDEILDDFDRLGNQSLLVRRLRSQAKKKRT
jgi:hypothetical protein